MRCPPLARCARCSQHRPRPLGAIATAALIAVATLAIAPPAHAQARSVTVVTLDAEPTLRESARELYDAVRTQVEAHPDYALNDIPPQTLDDLLLAIGCVQLDPECGSLLAELVGSNTLISGAIEETSSGYRVRLEFWDLESGTIVRDRSLSLPVDADGAREHKSMIARSVLYEASGELAVTTTPEGARVTLNGRSVGTTPLVVEQLVFGLYEVRIEKSGYHPRSAVVSVDLGDAEIDWTLEAIVVEPVETSTVPELAPWAVVGAGGALLAGSLVAGILTRSSQSAFDDEVSKPIFVPVQAEELQSEGERRATATNALLISGLLVSAGGAAWLLLSRRGDDGGGADADAGAADATIRVAPWLDRSVVGLGAVGRF